FLDVHDKPPAARLLTRQVGGIQLICEYDGPTAFGSNWLPALGEL
ncbi:MAG: hypothetical protein QOG19_3467, partial [Mycobacterium sp.]|nr:hypothetical protein [Mycobacterium sp.]